MTWTAGARRRFAWQWIVVLAAAIAGLATAALIPSTSGAAAFGELGGWGGPGFGDEANEFGVPGGLAVDPNDADSVYVSDLHLNESEELEFRVRKLSSDGSEAEGTTLLPL